MAQKEEEPRAREEEGASAGQATQATPGEEATDTERAGNLFGPEAVMMLFLAGIIDLIDAFVLSIVIIDIIAILTIGFWIYFRSQTMSVTKGAAKRLSKAARWLQLILGGIEFIPIVGMAPLWIVVVLFELRPDWGAKVQKGIELSSKVRKPVSPKRLSS